MSEPASPAPGRADIWIEKYRPERLADIHGHDDIIPRLQSYVERDDLPNLLFGGPAGTGKCVAGETPVITNRGVERIEDVVGDVEGFAAPPTELQILTFEGTGEFSFTTPDHVYSQMAEDLRTVRTRDGCDPTVTPEHRFLVLDHDGFRWVPADELADGDRIARPASLPMDSANAAVESSSLREQFDAYGSETDAGVIAFRGCSPDRLTTLAYQLAAVGIPTHRTDSVSSRPTLEIRGERYVDRFYTIIGSDRTDARSKEPLAAEPDTVPSQRAVERVGARLGMSIDRYFSEPTAAVDREAYQRALNRFVADARDRIDCVSGRLEERSRSSTGAAIGTRLQLKSETNLAVDTSLAFDLAHLDLLASAELYFDEVVAVESISGPRRVYDLAVPETRNYVAGTVPTVMHNTTAAQAIARELYGEDWQENFLELNASDDRGIDVVRGRIKDFARASFGGYDYRVIFLDEADSLCVPPGTEVVAGYPSAPEVKRIEEIAEDGEPMPSVDFETNEIQSDKGKLVDSGVADFFEIELEDGRSVLASLSHPFFVIEDNGTLIERELQDLKPGDEIADFGEDIGVSRCDNCGDWTAGRFCSKACKNEGHSREMQGDGNPMYGTTWSDERRQKIVEKLSDGRFAGENNPNYGGEFHGVHISEMDEDTIREFKRKISELRSGTTWEEWTIDADPEAVKEKIGKASSEWWASLDEAERKEIHRKAIEQIDYPVCDITGDNNPMRDPEIAAKVSKALKGHKPTGGGNVRYEDELGHVVRSDWEFEVAMALQDAGIEYEYEPAFELSDSVYHPDFKIGDTVIEVKGDVHLWGGMEKAEEFLELYGDEYRYVVIGDKELPHHVHYEWGEFDPLVAFDGGRRQVDTVRVRKINYSHRGKAYNITMEGTPNFMLGNGILTHNTSDAQAALRRTMEQFSGNTRFILSCNYSSQIIDPIQSRCAVFRFSGIDDEAVEGRVREIAAQEAIEVTDDGIAAIVYAANGDMRKAINALQAAAVLGETVDEETVYMLTSTARPEIVQEMVQAAADGDFAAARAILDQLLDDAGLAGTDVIDQLHRTVWDVGLSDRVAVDLLERIGEADFRIAEGANERIQLEALLASVANQATE